MNYIGDRRWEMLGKKMYINSRFGNQCDESCHLKLIWDPMLVLRYDGCFYTIYLSTITLCGDQWLTVVVVATWQWDFMLTKGGVRVASEISIMVYLLTNTYTLLVLLETLLSLCASLWAPHLNAKGANFFFRKGPPWRKNIFIFSQRGCEIIVFRVQGGVFQMW